MNTISLVKTNQETQELQSTQNAAGFHNAVSLTAANAKDVLPPNPKQALEILKNIVKASTYPTDLPQRVWDSLEDRAKEWVRKEKGLTPYDAIMFRKTDEGKAALNEKTEALKNIHKELTDAEKSLLDEYAAIIVKSGSGRDLLDLTRMFPSYARSSDKIAIAFAEKATAADILNYAQYFDEPLKPSTTLYERFVKLAQPSEIAAYNKDVEAVTYDDPLGKKLIDGGSSHALIEYLLTRKNIPLDSPAYQAASKKLSADQMLHLYGEKRNFFDNEYSRLQDGENTPMLTSFAMQASAEQMLELMDEFNLTKFPKDSILERAFLLGATEEQKSAYNAR